MILTVDQIYSLLLDLYFNWLLLGLPRRLEINLSAPDCRYALSNRLTCLSRILSILAASFCYRVFPSCCYIASNRASSCWLIACWLIASRSLTLSFPFLVFMAPI
jgi:hypothetical protein